MEIATEADVVAMTARVLDEIGLTYEQLEAQARDGDFTSEQARRAWFAISP